MANVAQSATGGPPLLQRRQTTREQYNNSVGQHDSVSLSDVSKSVAAASRKVSTTSQQDKDPLTVKDKLLQRLLMKMGKQFGDDPDTLQIISSVLQKKMKENSKLQPADID